MSISFTEFVIPSMLSKNGCFVKAFNDIFKNKKKAICSESDFCNVAILKENLTYVCHTAMIHIAGCQKTFRIRPNQMEN